MKLYDIFHMRELTTMHVFCDVDSSRGPNCKMFHQRIQVSGKKGYDMVGCPELGAKSRQKVAG